MTVVSFYLHMGRVTKNLWYGLDDSTNAAAITDQMGLSVCSGIRMCGINSSWVCVCIRGWWWKKSDKTFTLNWWQLKLPLFWGSLDHFWFYLNICSLQVCFAVVQQASVLDSVGICLIFSWQDKAHKQPNIKHIKQLPANLQQRPNLLEEEVGWEQLWWTQKEKNGNGESTGSQEWQPCRSKKFWNLVGM